MKVAIVSAVPAFPVNAGNRSRVLNLARAIRHLGHDLHFVYLDAKQPGGVDLDAHRREFGDNRLTVIRRLGLTLWSYRSKRLGWLLRRRVARALGSEHAYYNGIDELYSTNYATRLRALHREHGFDAVFVEYVFYSRVLDVFPDSVIKVIDMHDVFADRHVPFVTGDVVQPYMFSVPPERECDGLRRAHVALAIQAEEAESLGERMRASDRRGGRDPRIVVLSHLLDFPEPVNCAAASHATFVGSDSQPNRDAMRLVIEQILPRVAAHVPGFRLFVAGSVARSMPDHPHIVKLGVVERIADAFAQAPISINPMGMGTGINIKLLESMAAGVPIVTTQLGARGVDSRYLDGITVVADNDPQAFADAIVALTRDAARRTRDGTATRAAAHRWHEAQMDALRATLGHANAGASVNAVGAMQAASL